MDGWNTILSYWDSAYFQVLWPLVSGRVSPLNWRLARRDWTSTGSVSKGGFGGFFGNPPKFGDEQRCWGVFQIIFKKVDNFEDVFLTRIYCLGDFLWILPRDSTPSWPTFWGESASRSVANLSLRKGFYLQNMIFIGCGPLPGCQWPPGLLYI